MDRIRYITVILFFYFSPSGSASQALEGSVRILSWWGYIDKTAPAFSQIESACNAKISLDEFYSNTEFLERVSLQADAKRPYDVLIFSDTVYKSSQLSYVEILKTDIEVDPQSYDKDVAKFFRERKYHPSTAIFQISLTGFLVNKDRMDISRDLALGDIFNKAGSNLVVLLDDHVEISTLLNKWQCKISPSKCSSSQLFPDESELRSLVGQAQVLISSDLADITNHKNFALAYTWSGDAITRSTKHENLEFLVHPDLSHTSMDLITLAGQAPEAKCVAKALSSRAFIDDVASRSQYFSPFGPVSSGDSKFSKLEKQFFSDFLSLGRIQRLSESDSHEINKRWQLFKIQVGRPL